mmetsp:Transcript_18080/g.44678  ORF Transcript_18080/g.44678 Transcript_18080/m.44678 type:complete len:233 (-) Transcript_18080:167-865(-)
MYARGNPSFSISVPSRIGRDQQDGNDWKLFRKQIEVASSNLEGSNHVQVLSGKNVIDTVLAVQRILESSTSGFGLLFLDGRFVQATLTISTRILGIDTHGRVLRHRGFVEQASIGWKDLPFMAQVSEIVDNSGSITAQSLASVKVTQHTNDVAKGLGRRFAEVDLEEFLEGLDNNLLSGADRTQINGNAGLVRLGLLVEKSDWESSHGLNFILVLVVEPVVNLRIKLGRRSA